MSKAGLLLALMLAAAAKATNVAEAARRNGYPLLFATEPDVGTRGQRCNPDRRRGIR